MEITKEELVELIKSTIKDLQDAANEAPAEETKTEETVEETKTIEEPVEETKTEEKTEVENACGEEVKNGCSEEVKNGCGEEKPVNEEPDDDPEEEKEVIKLETLNQKPVTVDIAPAWQNLHGQAFWDYLAKHPEAK